MSAKIKWIIPLILGMFLAPGFINAAEVNVTSTINEAIKSASAGDTIVLEAKTYTEDVTVNKAVNIKGAGKDATVLNGHITVTADTTISDLTISDDGTTQTSGTGYGILVNAKSNVTVENALIKYSKYSDADYGNSTFFTGIWLSKSADASTLKVDATDIYAKYGIWVNGQNNNVTVNTSNIEGWAPLDISNGASAQTLASGNKVTVNSSTLTGVATVTGESNKYGVVVIGGQDGLKLEINSSTVQNKFTKSNTEDLILFGGAYKDSKNVSVTINDSKLINNDTNGESAVVNLGYNTTPAPSSNNSIELNNNEITTANGVEFTSPNATYAYVKVVVGDKIDVYTVEKNTLFDKPADPEVDGYTFNGWYTTEEYTDEFNFEEEITDDVTIYAKLDKNEEVTDNPSEDETEDDALLDDVPKTGEKFSFIKWLISLFR